MQVERDGTDRFIGGTPRETWPRLYGGSLLAQSLSAAGQTVDLDRDPHALHAWFLRPGDPRQPITFEVEPLRDGRSMSLRRVVASQQGRTIFTLSASFQIAQDGPVHQVPPRSSPPPETLIDEGEVRRAEAAALGLDLGHLTMQNLPIEMRPVTPLRFSQLKPEPPVADYWVRPLGPLPADRRILFCLLAYISDMPLLLTALRPHAIHYAVTPMDTGSLDHALWLHRPPAVDDWMFWSTHSPWGGSGRGLAGGHLYDRAGNLLATAMQEGLMRPH
nr:acyl-CoA thioesterase domain-containing protein [Sphingobium sp. Sx8-8]